MGESIRLNIVRLAGIIVVGIVFSFALPFLVSKRGSIAPGVLMAESTVTAIIVVLLVMAVGVALCVIVGRLTNTAVGMFVLGAGLFVWSTRSGAVHELAFAGGSLRTIGIEGMLWALLVLAATKVMFALSGPLRDIHPPMGSSPEVSLWSGASLRAAAAGVLVLPIVWILAQSPEKGQVIGAVIVGGLVAGLASRLMAPNVQPVLIFAAPALFGGLACLAAGLLLKTPIDEAFVVRAIPHVALPMPIDYAAGSVLGVAMGLGWAKSFLHHEDDQRN